MLFGGEEFTMSNLIGRAQNILLTPKTEWPVIAAEPETTAGLYTKYILILSAIGPIAMFLKSTLIGISVPFVGAFKVGIGAGLGQLALTYCLGLVGVFVIALIINALAPTFAAQKDSVQSLKAAAYASTAAWVAGIAQILPWGLGLLIGIAGGIYSIYLLYLGLQYTMKAPAEKAAGYTAVTIIAAIILYWIIGAIVGGIIGNGMISAMSGATSSVTPSGSFEKGSTGAAIEEWAKNVEAAGKNVENSAQQNGAPSACGDRGAGRRRRRGRQGRGRAADRPDEDIPARDARGPAAHERRSLAQCRDGFPGRGSLGRLRGRIGQEPAP